MRRREALKKRSFLRRVYEEWYERLSLELPPERHGRVLEIGSGAGFLGERVAGVLCSDVLALRGIDVVLDACALPFGDASLSAITMTNVFHHLPDCAAFLRDAARVIRRNGRIVMIEPWISPWSSFVYRRLHHEPCCLAGGWTFESQGPLSDANSALPWIVFARDRDRLTREFPEWQIRCVEPLMPIGYLLSGGFSWPALAPTWSFSFWRAVERPFARRAAMFALIVLERLPAHES